MDNTLIWFAQYEKNMIYKRTYAWKRQKCSQWKWIFPIPYWYKKDNNDELELFEEEVIIIKDIIRLYLDENYTIWKITRYLNQKKILPPSMSLKQYSSQTVKVEMRKNSVVFWTDSATWRILENVSKYYIGEYKAFATKYKKVWKNCIIIGERNEEEIINIKIPAIFSKEIVKKVEQKKKINKNHSPKHSFRNYLLKGKLFCDCCSKHDLHSFIGYFNNKKGLRNYRCSLMNWGKVSSDRKCNNSISWLKIEWLVIDTLKDFFLNYNKFLAEYVSENNDIWDNKNIIEEYSYEIHKLEEKKKKALNFALEGIIKEEEFKWIKLEIEEQINKINQKMNEEYELIYNEYKMKILH